LTTDSAAYLHEYRRVVEQDYEAFLASVKSGETIRQRANSFIEYGAPNEVLRRGVRDMDIDLIVLGTQGRSALSEALIGSVGKYLMSELSCDVLMIREPQENTETGV
jgi:nucleotide-binding universal stress UspA family protein